MRVSKSGLKCEDRSCNSKSGQKAPIQSLQLRIAVEAVVDQGYSRAPHEKKHAFEVELDADMEPSRAVAHDGMEAVCVRAKGICVSVKHVRT